MEENFCKFVNTKKIPMRMEFILNLLFLSDVNPILVSKGLYTITEMTIVVILTPKSPTIVDYIIR